MNRLFVRDEREASVDRAADRFAYLVMSFGLLAVVAYRSFVEGVASWELLALVLLGGAASTGYRVRARALTREVLFVLVATALVASAVSAVMLAGLRP